MFAGVAVVYDLQTVKPACQAPIKVESSETVATRRGIVTNNGESAIERDFKDQFKKAAQTSLAKISKSSASTSDHPRGRPLAPGGPREARIGDIMSVSWLRRRP